VFFWGGGGANQFCGEPMVLSIAIVGETK
jgi:hypothetical protein